MPASTTNVMTITIEDTPAGPFLTLSPPKLNILKGTGGNRFDQIVLSYPETNRGKIDGIRKKLDPAGTRGLGANGRIKVTMEGDSEIFSNQSSAEFELDLGRKMELRLKNKLDLQPGGTFVEDPEPEIAKSIHLSIRFANVTHPSLRLKRDSGDHSSWHVEC